MRIWRSPEDWIHLWLLTPWAVDGKSCDWPSVACCCFICWQFGCFRGMLCRERKGERKTESRMICCLFCCSGRLVSPKWKNFKGLKLQWRDKIRLNNAIWRAWYMQCKYRAGGGSFVRHRWEQENWTYCLVKSSGICSRPDVSEAVPLDRGFPRCAYTGDVLSAPSTAQDLPISVVYREGILARLTVTPCQRSDRAFCWPCTCSALAFSLLFQTWRSARTPCATLWPHWTAPWTLMSTVGQRCVKPRNSLVGSGVCNRIFDLLETRAA